MSTFKPMYGNYTTVKGEEAETANQATKIVTKAGENSDSAAQDNPNRLKNSNAALVEANCPK